MNDRQRLIELGWQQGILLTPDTHPELTQRAHYKIGENDLLLIVSQTCDLVQGDFEKEPYFEVLCLHPLERPPDGNFLNGKNNRRIEFSSALPGNPHEHWYALPFERHLVNRNLLLNIEAPDRRLEAQHCKMILRWLSLRYTRTAFPEAFVARINEGRNRRDLARIMRELNPDVSNIFVQIEPFEELDAQANYRMHVILVMDAVHFDDPQRHARCERHREALEALLAQCRGIEIGEVDLESTASVTIEELKAYREWDYSYLSMGAPEEAAQPIDNAPA